MRRRLSLQGRNSESLFFFEKSVKNVRLWRSLQEKRKLALASGMPPAITLNQANGTLCEVTRPRKPFRLLRTACPLWWGGTCNVFPIPVESPCFGESSLTATPKRNSFVFQLVSYVPDVRR